MSVPAPGPTPDNTLIGHISNKKLEVSNHKETNEKIQKAIPKHLAEPKEGHVTKITSEFNAEVIPNLEDAIETIKITNAVGTEALNLTPLNPEAIMELPQSNDNKNALDPLELGFQEDLFPDLDSEKDLSEEEIEAMMAALEKENLQLDREISDVKNENLEIDSEEQEAVDEIVQSKNSFDLEKTIIAKESKEINEAEGKIKVIESESPVKEVEEISLGNDEKKFATAIKKNLSEVEKQALGDIKLNKISEFYKEYIKKLENDPATPTTPEGKAYLKELREASEMLENLKQSRNSGEILKMYSRDGRSLYDMDMEEFEEALKNFHTLTFTFIPSDQELDKIKDDEGKGLKLREERVLRGDQKKEESFKEKLSSTFFSSSQRLISENITQQIRDRARHAEEKLEAQNEKNIAIRKEDIRNREIKKEAIENLQESKDLIDFDKLTKSIKFMLHNVQVTPPKKETLNMVISVIRRIESIPGKEKDQQLKSLQQTLIYLYSDIKQAIGVEVVGGTGTAPQIHTPK